MFFDETHIGTKPDVFSLESLIAWLEKMPADNAYNAANPRECLLGQWIMSAGVDDPTITSVTMGNRMPFNDIAVARPYTFGAALDRARALL